MKYIYWILGFLIVLLIGFMMLGSSSGSDDLVLNYKETQTFQTSKVPIPTKEEVDTAIKESISTARAKSGQLALVFPIKGDNINFVLTSVFKSRESGIHDSGHSGTDIAYEGSGSNPNAATIVSATDGEITQMQRTGRQMALHEKSTPGNSTLGVHVYVRDSSTGLIFQYGHMQSGSIPSNLKVGSKVKAGDKLGIMGTTGRSTGTHLHFGVMRFNGVKFALDTPSFRNFYLDVLDAKNFGYYEDTAPKTYGYGKGIEKRTIPTIKR